MKRSVDASNRRELVFSSPHRSRYISQTAGKDVLGRGDTVHYLHLSEVAFWQQDVVQLAGILQMVPYEVDTTVILETTANGLGGQFHDMFWQAVDRRRFAPDDYSGYLPVFFPWYRFCDYQLVVPAGFSVTSDERGYGSQFKLSDGQIYFRRKKIEELGGDESLFAQEYPSTPNDAFRAAGNPVFTVSMIDFQRAKECKKYRYGVFVDDEFEDVDRQFNCWQVNKLREAEHEYCIGVDTMEARLSDVDNPKSQLDCDAAAVMDRMTGEVVAVWHGRGSQKDLAFQVLWSGAHYNDAFIAPEIPNSMVLLNVLKEKGYDNVYNRQIHDQRLTVEDSENLGWRTDMITRKWLVDDFLTALRDGRIAVSFGNVIEEMETFIRDKNGKAIHRSGKHDDLLFAVMIALQVHLRCPLTAVTYSFAHTGSKAEKTEDRKGICYAGALDPGLESEENDDDNYTI